MRWLINLVGSLWPLPLILIPSPARGEGGEPFRKEV